MNHATDGWTIGVIFGMAAMKVLTRCFFFILERPWTLPAWANRALQYAPAAALAAVVVPEVVMTEGHLVTTWQDARSFAAAAGVAVYFWRRNLLLMLVVGMLVYLPLHVWLAW